MSLLLPLCFSLAFPLWYRCIGKDENTRAKRAIMQAGVQVVYVWLFTTIVAACFLVLDCTPANLGDSILILDPTLPCPLGGYAGSDAGPAVFAIIVFLLYAAPFIFRLLSLRCKSDSWWDRPANKARWRWAREDYAFESTWVVRRRLALNWEAVVVLTKLFMVGGSVLMYPYNRFITHVITLSVVLLLQLCVRPYGDTFSNVSAIAFTVCDVVGIVSASSQNAADQVAFIVILLLVLVLVLLPLLFTCRARLGDAGGGAAAVASSRGLASSSMFAEFTDTWEKVLVAPYLLIATVLSRVAVLVLCISPRDGSNGGSGDGGTGVTKVSPNVRSWE